MPSPNQQARDGQSLGSTVGVLPPLLVEVAEQHHDSASGSGLSIGGVDGLSSSVISITAPDRLRGSGLSSDHLPTLRTPLATLGAFLQGLWS